MASRELLLGLLLEMPLEQELPGIKSEWKGVGSRLFPG